MAKQTIDIGTSPNKGDGDPLRSAFIKINNNFTELYTSLGNPSGATANVLPDADGVYDLGSADKQWADVFIADFIYLNGTRIEVNSNGALLVGGSNPIQTQDTIGSVFGDDSTLLVDGVNNTIPSANITGTEAANWDTAFLWGDHSAAGYAPQATTYTKVEVDAAIAAVDPFSGDVTGSVFADDSTLLVDGVNGTIPAANLSGALPAIDGSALTNISGPFVGDLTGSVFADDSTLLVDGVGGTIAGPISSINWMAASDSYLTISNGGSTQPGPIQIVASANLDLSSGNNNDINITPHGSGRVKVSDGAFGIVEAATFIGHADETMYLSSKTTGAESTHITLNSTSGVATTMYGAVDFVSGGSVDFTGSTVTGLNVTGDITGSIFADDSTLLVDGVNGTIPAANLTGALPAIDGSALLNLPAAGATEINDLTDVDTTTIAPSRDTQPLVWDTVDGNWYPGNGISISAIARIETGGMLYFDASSSMVFEGTTSNTFETTITASDPSQDNAIVIPDASGTLALTSDIPSEYTQLAQGNSYVSISDTGSNGEFAVFIDGNFEMRVRDTGMRLGASSGIEVDTILDEDNMASNSDKALATQQSIKAYVDANSGGASSRSTATGTTSSLADAAEADLDITGFKSYALLTITTDRAARVRLYVNAATRTADASRAEGVDPTSDAGLIAEVITTGAETVIISPGAYGFNLESSPTTTIPCRVTNKSGSASTVQVDLNILQLEA